MLNAHAARMDCLVCHWSPANGSRPAPAWQVQGTAAFLAVLSRERASKEQLEALRAAVLQGRRCFERGPGCAGCHRPGDIGALLRPGSPPDRVRALGSLVEYFTLAPGEKWYFPRIQ
jgi:mono/diheme cytochrome c family protein